MKNMGGRGAGTHWKHLDVSSHVLMRDRTQPLLHPRNLNQRRMAQRAQRLSTRKPALEQFLLDFSG